MTNMNPDVVKRLLQEGHSLEANEGRLRPSEYRRWRESATEVSRLLEEEGAKPLSLSPDDLAQDLARLERLLATTASASSGETANTEAAVPEVSALSEPGAESGSSISVFISHKMSEDRTLATALRNRLSSLSNRKVKVLMAQGIPGAKAWQEWVEENVRNANVLLFLHTSDDHDNDWLLYEAGLYRGSRDSDVHLVCIKNPDLDRPPPQLARLQAYDATEDGITKFLMDLLYRGVFSGGNRLNDAIRDEQEEDFQETVRDIVSLFAERQVSVTYFRTRLEVGPIDVDETIPVEERLRRSTVQYNELTGALLGLPEVRTGELNWGQVRDQFDATESPWVQELEEVVCDIDQWRYFSQVLSSFESVSGRRCFPVVSRVERLKGKAKSITVIFLERQVRGAPEERLVEPMIDDSSRSPEAYSAVVSLLNFARRFRWNILSHYLAELEGFKASELDVGKLGRELRMAIEAIEAQADDAGFNDPAHVAASFPVTYRETIKELFVEYGALRGQLMTAIEHADRDEIVSALHSMGRMNKRFLLAGLNRYKQLVQELDPLDIDDELIGPDFLS